MTQTVWKPHRCYASSAESSGGVMKGFVQGTDRQQTTLLPECLDDWVDESNAVRAVDVFVDALELRDLGFDGIDPGSDRPARVSSLVDAQALHLRLSPTGSNRAGGWSVRLAAIWK